MFHLAGLKLANLTVGVSGLVVAGPHTRRLVYLVIVAGMLTALLGACGGSTANPPTTGEREDIARPTGAANTAPAPTTNLDVSVGAPPLEGWRWVVAVIDTSGDAVVEGLNAGHEFFWVFYPVKGSTEITTAAGPKLASAGQAIMLPAKQEHSHRYLPESRTLAFDVRSANDNPSAFHRGTEVLLSDKLLLAPGSEYKLRIRTYTVPPGQRVESRISDASFIYVVEGVLEATAGDDSLRFTENQAFALSVGTKLVASNEEKGTLRFILVDIHP